MEVGNMQTLPEGRRKYINVGIMRFAGLRQPESFFPICHIWGNRIWLFGGNFTAFL